MRVRGTAVSVVEPVSARDLLEVAKHPSQPIESRAQSFLAYAFMRAPEGVPYLIPRDLPGSKRVDSLCHGSRIDAELLLPALVASKLLVLKRLKDYTQLQFNANNYEAFSTLYPHLDIEYLHKRSANKNCYMIVRGTTAPEYLSPGGNVRPPSPENPTFRPRATEPLPTEALEIAMDIQTKALEMYDELYDILQIERNGTDSGVENTPTNVDAWLPSPQVNDNHSTNTKTAVAAAPNECQTTTNAVPTGIVTIDDKVFTAREITIGRAIQKACELLKKDDGDGALKVLAPFRDTREVYNGPIHSQTVTIGDKCTYEIILPEGYEAHPAKDIAAWKESHERIKAMKTTIVRHFMSSQSQT